LGNKARYLIFNKFFTINYLQQISRKYSKNVLKSEGKTGFQNVKLFNIL